MDLNAPRCYMTLLFDNVYKSLFLQEKHFEATCASIMPTKYYSSYYVGNNPGHKCRGFAIDSQSFLPVSDVQEEEKFIALKCKLYYG